MGRVLFVLVVLALGAWAGVGCRRFEEEGSSSAHQTQPARERLSEATEELVRSLQERVDGLAKDLEALKQRVDGADESGQQQ